MQPVRTRFGVKLASHYLTVGDILTLAVRAEELGFDSVWSTEGRMAPDSVTVISAVAAVTRQVRLGTSVINPFTRSPGLVALTAASLDQISGGRFVLGIGAGDPRTLEQQDIPYDRPLARLRDYVAVARSLWAGERVCYTGRTIQVTDLVLDVLPREGSVPVYVGATGPRALRQANEIGDGILLNVCMSRARVEPVLAIADRSRGVKVVGNVIVGMHADRDQAVQGTKPIIVRYLTRFAATAQASGVPQALLDDLRAAADRNMEQACRLLPDSYVRELAAVGTPDDCRQWIAEYAAGMDEALLTPVFGDTGVILDELVSLCRKEVP